MSEAYTVGTCSVCREVKNGKAPIVKAGSPPAPFVCFDCEKTQPTSNR